MNDQPDQQATTPPCSTHPDAPHGFDRDGSHTAGRYVCDCEGWVPPDQQDEPPACPFCDAPRVRISEPHGVWDEYECGTRKGAKGSKWLWFQTYKCKEDAKKS